jgi:hypothetical protein
MEYLSAHRDGQRSQIADVHEMFAEALRGVSGEDAFRGRRISESI